MSDTYVIAVLVGGWILIFGLKFLNARQQARAAVRSSAPVIPDADKEKVSAAVNQAKLFMDASLLMVDQKALNREKTQKVGACMYLVGAVDALAQHYKLNDAAFHVAAVAALRNFGLSEDNAWGFSARIPAMSLDSFGRSAMTEGGRAVLQWISGADPNAPLRLFELVRTWEANPEQGF